MSQLKAVCNGPTRSHAPRVFAVLRRDTTSPWGMTVVSPEAEGFTAPTGTAGAPTWTSGPCPHCGTRQVLPAATAITRADAALGTVSPGFHYVPVDFTN